MKGYIKFRDEVGVEASAWLRELPEGTAINQVLGVATHLHGHSNAGISEYGLLDYENYAPNAGTKVTGANIHNKARCHFTYGTPLGETKLMSLWFPAPMMTNFEHLQGVGYRMTAAAGLILQTALRTLTGITDILFSIGMLAYRESEGSSRDESSIQYEDSDNQRCWVSIPQPVSAAAMEAFNNNTLNNFTMCACTDAVFCEKTVVAVPDSSELMTQTPSDLGFDSVRTRAALKFNYSIGTKRYQQSLNLPAVKLSVLQSGSDTKGYKLQEVVGDGVALALTSIYGSGYRNFIYKNSKISVVKGEKQ